MDALEAYDLTGSYRSAALLTGCDHHTVKRLVTARNQGLPAVIDERTKLTDPFIDLVDQWVQRSKGMIRADKVHDRLIERGYQGADRTTRRVVAASKRAWELDNRRSYKPWITEPGMWLQYDYGHGPVVDGVQSQLFCAWLAWSRYRVVIPLRDKTLPSVIYALDRCFRLLGGAPTYVLTDNEKTVTTRHIARVAVRHPMIVSAGHYYGVKIETCAPADPESKGGSEATVKIAKADLIPSDVNLGGVYATWEDLEQACTAFMGKVNHRVHRVTTRTPAGMLVEELVALHQVPDEPFTMAAGETRTVSWSQTIQYKAARYSVPRRFCDQVVWVRRVGDDLVITGRVDGVMALAAQHQVVPAGQTSLDDDHYPHREPGSGPRQRQPAAVNPAEAAFLKIGVGASQWLIEAAGAGVLRIEALMAEAVDLADVHTVEQVDTALAAAALWQRFERGDIESILLSPQGPSRTVPVEHSLQTGTASWASVQINTEKGLS